MGIRKGEENLKARIDIIGKKFGKWTVLKYSKSGRGKTYWTCVCECGTVRDVDGHGMKNGTSASCGCVRKSNIIGNRYGFLTVIQDLGVKKTVTSTKEYHLYLCKCDCGVEKEIILQALGHGTNSCGCYNRSGTTKRNIESKLPYGVASFNNLYYTYKKGANERCFEFQLTKEEFSTLTLSNCHYCGVEPKQVIRTKTSTPYTYNGVDRADNSVGYIMSNVVPCCGICNLAKRTMKLEEFLDWLDRIAKFRTNLKVMPSASEQGTK